MSFASATRRPGGSPIEPVELLRHVADALEAMGLRYFVTGSTATIFYGEPRFTNDIDVVVDLAEPSIAEFCARFPEDEFYVSSTAALEAVRSRTQFNIIHPASGLKVDVIVPESTPFNESRFARARYLHAGEDFKACFVSPEDVVIMKMVFYREGGSEKHLRDIAGVLATCREQLDIAYVSHWCKGWAWPSYGSRFSSALREMRSRVGGFWEKRCV